MSPDEYYTAEHVDRRVRAWLEQFVVGLNVCPFARPMVSSEALRIVVCDATQYQDVAANIYERARPNSTVIGVNGRHHPFSDSFRALRFRGVLGFYRRCRVAA